jgi:hypothetical protein
MCNSALSPIDRRALLRMCLIAATCVVTGCSGPAGSEEGGTDLGASRRADGLKSKFQQIRAKSVKK